MRCGRPREARCQIYSPRGSLNEYGRKKVGLVTGQQLLLITSVYLEAAVCYFYVTFYEHDVLIKHYTGLEESSVLDFYRRTRERYN
jgi:hypothetical protein